MSQAFSKLAGEPVAKHGRLIWGRSWRWASRSELLDALEHYRHGLAHEYVCSVSGASYLTPNIRALTAAEYVAYLSEVD